MTFALSTVFLLMPRMNWSASGKRSTLENRIASTVRKRWIGIHCPNQRNPLALNPDNLVSGREDYDEHCFVCHGLDGSGENRIEADFYPRVPRLTGDTQQLSDAQNLLRHCERRRPSGDAGVRRTSPPRGDLEADYVGAPSCCSDGERA